VLTAKTREKKGRTGIEKPSYGFEASGNSTAAMTALFFSFAFFRDLPEPWSLLLIPLVLVAAASGVFMFVGMTDWYRLGLDERIMELAHMGRASKPLNYACGTGSLAVSFARFIGKGEVHACDNWTPTKRNPDPAAKTRNNMRIEGVEDIVMLDSVELPDLPYGNATFHVVGSRYGITNTRKRKKQAVVEMLRVLKSSGRLATAEGLPTALWLKYRVLRPLERDFRVSDVSLTRYHFTWIVSAQKLG